MLNIRAEIQTLITPWLHIVQTLYSIIAILLLCLFMRNCNLYRYFDADGLLLYVGIAFNPVSRLERHSIDDNWFREIKTITVETFNSRNIALKMEEAAIKREKPKYNKIHNGVINVKETVMDKARTMNSASSIYEQYLILLEMIDLNLKDKKKEFCEANNISESKLSRILNGKQQSSLQLLDELCFYTDIDASLVCKKCKN